MTARLLRANRTQLWRRLRVYGAVVTAAVFGLASVDAGQTAHVRPNVAVPCGE